MEGEYFVAEDEKPSVSSRSESGVAMFALASTECRVCAHALCVWCCVRLLYLSKLCNVRVFDMCVCVCVQERPGLL